MLTKAEMYVLALRSLACDMEPEGLHNPHDTEERERLAVACVRGVKDAEGMEPERERFIFASAERLASQWTQYGKCVRGFIFRVAMAQVEHSASLTEGLPDEREPFAFFRSRFVNVNGKTLKLKWAV